MNPATALTLPPRGDLEPALGQRGAGEDMNETAWLGCGDPDALLRCLRGRVSERKVRLFACACLRRLWTVLPNDRCRRAVEVIERCADGLEDRRELDAALADAEAVEAARTGPARAAARV